MSDNDADMTRLWRKITDNQRLYLMNLTAPYAERVPQSACIVAGRALDKMGIGRDTQKARTLAAWAREHGYAQFEGKSWTFTEPTQRPWSGRIDQARLAELAEAGWYATQIAKELNVSREAVRQAARRLGLTLAPKPKKPRPEKAPRVLRRDRIVFQVSSDERAAIQQAASRRGLDTSAYLRELCAAAGQAPE